MFSKKKFKSSLVFVFLILFCVTFVVAAGAAEQEKNGFTFARAAEAKTLLPTTVRSPADYILCSVFYEGLMVFNINGAPQPHLAKSVIADPDEKTYTIELHEGILFHDGTELTADVCKWNLDLYMEEGIFSTAFLGEVESIEVTGDYTVVMHLSNWDSLIPYGLARQAGYMVSQEAYETKGKEQFEQQPIGTGPFMVDNWEHGVGMSFVKFEDYWQGEPILDYINSKIYSEELVARAALEAGDIDLIITSDYDTVQLLDKKGFTINVSGVPAVAHTMCYNMVNEDDPFHNRKVREAVSCAINVENINRILGGGYSKMSTHWSLPGSLYYNEDIRGYPYDIERAKELLDEAGYSDGFTTPLYIEHTWPIMIQAGQIIAEELKKIGVIVDIQVKENWPNYLGGWTGMLIHPMGMANGAASQISANFVKGLDFGLGVNSFVFTDELDAVIREARSADQQTASELIQKAQAMIFDDYIMMKPIMISPVLAAVNPSLRDTGFAEATLYSTTLYKAYWEED